MIGKLKVERGAFLSLAAALAGLASAQACVTTNTASDDDDGGSGGSVSQGGTTAKGGASADGGMATDGGMSADGGMATDGGAATNGGAANGGAVNGGAANEGGASVGGAGTCDDSVGSPDCEGQSLGCLPYCNAAVANLKPAAAVVAVACLAADLTDNCDAGYSCLSDATAEGCAVDVATECAAAAISCGAADAGDPSCEQLLSGMNRAGRAETVTCLENNCFSVYSCAEGVFFL